MLEVIEKRIEDYGLLDNKILVVQMGQNEILNKNLTGLIANQLASKYQRPTLILNKTINQELGITWEGSGRNYEHSPLEDFRQFLNETGLVMYAEGHAGAFGVGITDKNFSSFIDYTNKALADMEFTTCYRVDEIYNRSKLITDSDILKIASLKSIWGQGLPEPLIAIEGLNIHSGNITLKSPNKCPTLCITLPNGIELIKFNIKPEKYEELVAEATGYITVNVVGKCDLNAWNGNITPQLKLEDYEIVGSEKYYF